MPSRSGSFAARLARTTCSIAALLLALCSAAHAQDPGWPREMTKDGVQLVYYQPQADDWKDFTDLDFRLAVSVTPKGGKPVLGVVRIHAKTDVDVHARTVLLHDLTVTGTSFPSLDAAAAERMNLLARTFLAPDKTVTISLDRLVASVEKPDAPAGVQLDDAPPAIFVSFGPAILVQVEGEPAFATIPGSGLEFLVNTNWPLFRDETSQALFLYDGRQWLGAPKLDGPWAQTRTLPKGMAQLAKDPQWKSLAKAIPAPAPAGTAPAVFTSDKPAEIIVFAGQPVYAPIPGTQLVYAKNTETPLFVYSPASAYYVLTAGRWFRASDLKGPWTFASADLPPDFAAIPADSPMGFVRASVPGTDEAKDAVLLAQIPTTVTIDPVAAAKEASVAYDGPPKFEPITGTSLSYASNTPDKVIKVGDVYYLLLQGVWFMSTTPQGPWQTAPSVPKEIYAIPPSSPVYNVTYVTQVTTPSGAVQSSYTAGYLGAFIMGATVGAVVASGTGYYHPPYVYYPPVGYPVYRPYPVPYGAWGAAPVYVPRTGAYGVGTAAYGPYGGVAAASTYNPYTGTYARGATAYGPYGSASAGQAYNPYTGTYARGATASGPGGTRTAAGVYNPYTGAGAATRQGSSPYAQWGSSVVTNGSQTAYAQHASNARGTVGSVQTSSGGKAAGASTSYGNTGVAKTSGGDVYAGHDGNVYKNTGSGWQKYDGGSWNDVQQPSGSKTTSTSSSASTRQATTTGGTATSRQANAQGATRTQPRQAPAGGDAAASGVGGLQREAQSRQRGALQSERYESASRAAFGGSGAERGTGFGGRAGAGGGGFERGAGRRR